MFLSRNNFNDILLEQKRLECISTDSTKKLVNGLILYLDRTFGVPSSQDIKTTCIAAITLFPCLRTDPSEVDGIDRLYNIKTHSGVLFHKIKNNRSKNVKATEPNDQQMTKEEETQLIAFFESAACTNAKEKKKIKEKLECSIELRQKLLETGIDLHEAFRFFYVSPDLVSLCIVFIVDK